ncbi:ABC transporter permease [Nocardioides sp. GCM10027113]|uniref:ABC transporter permease n=1 Tax=unclassified Nocardioides TaxID=2615069 RepID=UPI003609564D
MTTTATSDSTAVPGSPAGPAPTRAATGRPAAQRIPLTRLVAVEARKSFDTRAGFWLLASIGIVSVLATGAVILWAPESELTYATFSTAVGFPMAVILPMIAILSVTAEWSQRNGLTTFTLVPHRGRTILAKGVVAVGVGVVSMLVAMVVGAAGNVAGTALAGTDPVWNSSAADLSMIVVGNVLGLMVGFMLGVVVRGSAGAIVAYFVYSLVLPPISGVLAFNQEWFRDLQPWVDFRYAQGALFEGLPSAEQWQQIAASGALWLVLPLAVGLRILLRSEVK